MWVPLTIAQRCSDLPHHARLRQKRGNGDGKEEEAVPDTEGQDPTLCITPRSPSICANWTFGMLPSERCEYFRIAGVNNNTWDIRAHCEIVLVV